jgi:N6-L-threonylcarbamoyladenine synthase
LIMFTLGIETSCDETSVSVVKDAKQILSNVVSSSVNFHKKYGGVIPEIASRHHLEVITYTLNEALKVSKLKLKDVGQIAVTSQPGLKGCLLIGLCFARALSLALKVPLVEVNHLYAHIFAPFLETDRHYNLSNPKKLFPFLGLVVSGGHTSLFLVKDFDNLNLLGSTLDDACGEAFDKVAKILNLGYPGGPLIEKNAKKGNPRKIKFAKIKTKRPLDFSFSGIKTAVLYYLRDAGLKKKKRAPLGRHKLNLVNDICASFQETVIDTLVEKTFLACRMNRLKLLSVGGGVAANQRLRRRFLDQARNQNLQLYFSPLELSTDNAAMVALLGYQLIKKGKVDNSDLVNKVSPKERR